MSYWQDLYQSKLRSSDEAVAAVASGSRVYVHMGAAAPQELLRALCRKGDSLRNVEVLHCITLGAAEYAEPHWKQAFRANTLFTAANVRGAVNEGRADHIPVFLHEIERLLEGGALPVDAALIQTAPPDRHGWLSLGPDIDISLTAAQHARYLIVQVNERMPRTHGDSCVHVRDCHSIVEHT
jgi:acyl-CoA hydrolase